MNDNCWIPPLEIAGDKSSWDEYEDILYDIFHDDFIADHPSFKGKRVNVRRHPMEFGKEEAFYHVTCQDYQKNHNRVPDLRRCERIRWVRAFIENYDCDPTLCEDCTGIKIWNEPYKNTQRTHILLEEERYLVVLERRDSYYLLVTAFYIEHDHTLQKKLKKYYEATSKA